MQDQPKSFKIKINKNGLRLPLPGGVFSENKIVSLSAEEFFQPAIQMAIQTKLVTIEEKPDDKEIKGKLFRLIRKHSIGLPKNNQKISPNQIFFLSDDQMEESIIQKIIKDKWIIEEKEYQASLSPQKNIEDKKETIEKEVPVKKVKQVKQVKQKQVKQVKIAKKEVKGIENVPVNMYVHVPEVVRGDVEIKKIPRIDGIIDLSSEDEDSLSFVDQEQAQEKLAQNRNNNQEVE